MRSNDQMTFGSEEGRCCLSDIEPDQGSDMSACIMRCGYNYRVSEAQRKTDGVNIGPS